MNQFSQTDETWITQADTFFIASCHSEFGADASHRGGFPGFVRVINSHKLVFPDYAGNNMFQTFGNLFVNPYAGLLFVDFESGHTLQLTGQVKVIWDAKKLSEFAGAQRFNVGLAIELQAFTPLQVLDLSQRYGLHLSEDELSELLQLVAGHPYLVQQALYHLARKDLTLKQLIQTAATNAGIYCNHLHRHLRSLQEHPQLAAAYEQAIASSTPIEIEQLSAFKLHSMGLVKLHENLVMPSCELYRRYFSKYIDL